MEIKKMPKADLENKKFVFLQIGIVLVLSLVLIASEWSTKDLPVNNSFMEDAQFVEVEMIPITIPKETTPPPPPPKPTDILNIVDNKDELINELVVTTTEMNSTDGIELVELPVEIRDPEETFTIVEEMPEFPGGDAALMRYLAKSVRYPVIAEQNNIQGRVYIQFVINTNGEVTNAIVLRGVDPSLDKEAIRVVENMPSWKPGKQRNKPVRVSFTVPINFVLHTR